MKKLLALAAVAAMGISVVGATPQTQFKAGQTQVDAGALYTQTDGSNWQSDRYWNGTAGVMLLPIVLLCNMVTLVCTQLIPSMLMVKTQRPVYMK